ncbi:MAG TPA: dNTP triphosphohydrolase [Bryobacteraceae bacterium]|nr:dNTP triphosphohydrolase [Bryobacteraceae bacterium]
MNTPLGHLRFPAVESRGRRYPELAHPFRSDFQRDRDRVIHSRAFRRLEDKTQVFTPDFSDHFRNRLTHTIEVTQISRTAAGALGLNEQLAEALALAHDIGHPPFAHAGEDELNRRMQPFGDTFDHNLHALRIVESFEHRYARFPGLNLTFEVREGIVKHSRDFEPGEIPELDEYLPGRRPPLEAQLIDLADEVAYGTSDLDDGYSAALFTIAEVSEAVPAFTSLYSDAEVQFPGAPEKIRFQEVLRALVDWLVSGLIIGTIEAVKAAGIEEWEQVRTHRSRLACFTQETQTAARALKQFLHWHVYFSEPLVEERRRSAAMLGDLFAYYLEHPAKLPDQYREAMEQAPAHRVVCDYLAGMTDGFCRRAYQHAFGATSA